MAMTNLAGLLLGVCVEGEGGLMMGLHTITEGGCQCPDFHVSGSLPNLCIMTSLTKSCFLLGFGTFPVDVVVSLTNNKQ